MKERLAAWAILAGGIALTTAAFFASADVTHWVMSQHRTDVVVRPGPTVYVTRPASPGHARHRARAAPAPAAPAGGAGIPSQQDARARPDHKGDHARRHHRGGDARGHRVGDARRHGGDHAWPRQGGPQHSGSCHGQDQTQRIIAATVATRAVNDALGCPACNVRALPGENLAGRHETCPPSPQGGIPASLPAW